MDGNTVGEVAPAFMPGIDCLGDILEAAGYRNVFMGGADLDFAGKRKFFVEHGYQEIWGREEWTKRGHLSMGPWGLHDDALLEEAAKRLDQLQADPRPFNLTILTLDTHHPDGFISPTCRKRGAEELAGIVECTSQLLAEFVADFFRKGHERNTDLVIMGDHLSMKNAVYDRLVKAPERRVYVRFHSARHAEANRTSISHFSMLPTILASLGFEAPHGRLALGVSAFGDISGATMKLFSEADADDKLSAPASIYSKFWGR